MSYTPHKFYQNNEEEPDLESTSQDDVIFQNQCFLIDMAHNLAKINFGTKYKHFKCVHGDPPTMPSKLFGNKNYEPLWSITPDILAKMQPKIKIIKTFYDKNGREADYIEMPFAEYFDTSELGNILQERISRGSGVGLVKFDWALRGSNPAEAERSIQVKTTIRFETIQDFVKKRDINTAKGVKRFSFADFFTNPSRSLGDNCDPGAPSKFNPDFFTLKVIVGWNDIEGLDENVPVSYRKKLSKCIKKDTKTMILTQARHKINFTSEGVVNIEIEAFARYDIVSSINSSDIFEPYRKQYKLELAEESVDRQAIRLRNLDKCKPDELSDDEWKKKREEFRNREEELLKRAEKSRDLIKTKIWSSFIGDLIKNKRVFNLYMPLEYAQIESDNTSKYGRYAVTGLAGSAALSVGATALLTGGLFVGGALAGIGGLAYYGLSDEEERKKIDEQLTLESLQKNFDSVYRKAEEYIEGTPEFESLKRADHIKNRIKGRVKKVGIAYWNGNAKFVSDIKKTGEIIKGEDDYNFNKGADLLKNNTLKTIRDGIDESEEVYNMPYFYFGDIIDFCYRAIQDGNSYNTARNKALVGDITIMNANEGQSYNINMADIPISMVSFQNWFLEAVYKKQRTNYPAREFMTDILEQLLIESLKPNKCFGDLPEKAYTFSYLEYTFPTKDLSIDPLDPKDCGRISVSNLVDLKEKERHIVDAEYYNYQLFYCSSYDPDSSEATNEIADNNRGIPWIYIGKDRGLVKDISFDRSDIAFYREAHITEEGNNHEFDSLREAYRANIIMVGNNFFFPGQMVFVNPSTLALGSGPEGQELIRNIGFVGYYLITEVNSYIEAGKFETTVSAVWTSGGQGRTESELIRRYRESKGELTLCECENGVKVVRPKPVVPEFAQDLKAITIEPLSNYRDVNCQDYVVVDFGELY